MPVLRAVRTSLLVRAVGAVKYDAKTVIVSLIHTYYILPQFVAQSI
jgi:hypothetical protein